MITEKRNHSAFSFITTHICCYRNCEYFSIRCATHCQFCIVFVCTVIRKREMDMAHSHICCIKPTHKRHPILTTYFICDAIRLCVCVCFFRCPNPAFWSSDAYSSTEYIQDSLMCDAHNHPKAKNARAQDSLLLCTKRQLLFDATA